MANSVDTDQNAPKGAVCSGSTLFASILNSSVMLGNCFQRTTFLDGFFLGALRVKHWNGLDRKLHLSARGEIWLALCPLTHTRCAIHCRNKMTIQLYYFLLKTVPGILHCLHGSNPRRGLGAAFTMSGTCPTLRVLFSVCALNMWGGGGGAQGLAAPKS